MRAHQHAVPPLGQKAKTREATFWNLPDQHFAIFAGGSDNMIIERIESGINDRRRVTRKDGVIGCKFAHLSQHLSVTATKQQWWQKGTFSSGITWKEPPPAASKLTEINLLLATAMFESHAT